MVYVISKDGQPLMPTKRHGKVRRLLKEEKAIVIKRCPFTIQLTYRSTNHTQEIKLGVDAGSKRIGLSATTPKEVLYESEVELRKDIVSLLSARRQSRRARRSRKTRYREPRFNNRKASKKPGWLAPSVKQRVDSHLATVDKVHKMLPITKITVETASFDIQKIKAIKEGKPLPKGCDYQQGEQMGFWNVREYVLFRDNHTCQCCKGKSKDKILNVHHIESRKTDGDAPNNLITLCETCHTGYHEGTVKLPKSIKRGMVFRDAAFMGIMRWTFYNELKALYPDVSMTFGYITKNTRIKCELPKEHYIDARCISGNPLAVSDGTVFRQKKVRCHNRQLHKFKIQKGDTRKNNQAPYFVKGFRLFDKVLYEGKECFIFGRRTTGRMDLRLLDGTHVHESVSHKDIKLIESRKNYITERRTAIPPTSKPVGSHAG